MDILFIIGIIVVGIIALCLFLSACYKKAPPTEALVITGMGREPKVICGKGSIVIPVLQRVDKMLMRIMKLDVKTPATGVKTSEGVSVFLDSVVTVQGHSINVDLELSAVNPPDFLYHGTAKRNVNLIMSQGIKSMTRQYVHLSSNFETAVTVGARHGEAIVFKVNTQAMNMDGIPFYRAENGVWLTNYVDPKYLSLVYDETTPDD